MPDSNKEKRDLATGILNIIGGIGSLADLAYPGVGTGIRMAATGTDTIVKAALPDETGYTPGTLTPAQLEGLLIQAEPAPHVYLIEGGKKRWVSSEAVMRGRFKGELVAGRWNNVHYVTQAVASQFPDGAPVNEATPSPPAAARVAEAPREPEMTRQDRATEPQQARESVRTRARAFDAPTFGNRNEEV